ncbi:MAG: hypothetical protein RBR59_07910 [Sulfurimonadaceae bacterium]|jgi:hypothetical protein|nr:hypothetical protein [Sulfurimonadaceae bacterium]
MELKDVILSTLAEMEDEPKQTPFKEVPQKQIIEKEQTPKKEFKEELFTIKAELEASVASNDNEVVFLQSIRERLLVLFEGFQAPNNANIEAKIDLTLNFLEYILATIDERLEKVKTRK